MSETCATCGQKIRKRVKFAPLTCPVCEKVVPWPGRGARPKTHPECRVVWAKMRRVAQEENET